MLLMATSLEEQQFWTGRLLKKIQKGGYKAAGQVSHPSGGNRSLDTDMWAEGWAARWDQLAELCPTRLSWQSWHSTESHRGSGWHQFVEFHSSRQFWLKIRLNVKSSAKCFVVLVIVGKETISIVNFYTLQGDGTKISPQESMRSQYKPNIQV